MRKNKTISKATLFTFLLFYVTFSEGFAQKNVEYLKSEFISISEGLASPDVIDIMQDSYGLLWLTTSNGLQVYDGVKFETFKSNTQDPESILDNNTWSLVEDNQRNIWVSNQRGISRFDRKQKSFTNYALAEQFNFPEANGLVIHLFKDSKGNLWAATIDFGLIYYDAVQDRWRRAKTSLDRPLNNGQEQDFALAFTEDIYGGYWAGYSDKGFLHKSKSDSLFRPVSLSGHAINFVDLPNNITALYADSSNVIWMTTRSGIYKYYPNNGQLKTIITYNYNLSDRRNNLNTIQPDHEGNIWINNSYRGILKFDGTSDHYQHCAIDGSLFMSDLGWDLVMTDFTIDKSGIFWFGSWRTGMIKYDPDKKPFSLHKHQENNKNSLSNNAIFGLQASELNPDLLYVGTRGGYLNTFNQTTQTFREINYDAVDDTYGGSVRSIAESDDGTLWLGTWGDGLIHLDKNDQEIARYKYNSKDENSISDNKVRVLQKDKYNNLWVGTTNGLNYFNTQTKEFKRIPTSLTRAYPQNLINKMEALFSEPKCLAKISHVKDYQDLTAPFKITNKTAILIMAVGEGLDGIMADFGWIENEKGDTIWNMFDLDKTFYAGGNFKNRILIDQIELEPGSYMLRYFSDDSHSFNAWNADAPNRTSNYGIFAIDAENTGMINDFTTFSNQINSEQTISGVSITAIDLHDDYVWIATGSRGLNKIDLTNNAVEIYEHDPADPNSLCSNNLLDVVEDKNGIVWITTSNGLNRFDPKTEEFTHYTEVDGLPTIYLESILEGDNSEMWISSNAGLTQMVSNETIGKVTFINFNAEDGLGGDTFVGQVAARMADGTFYFGGDHGLNAISSITANNTPPDIIFSDLLISNKSIFQLGDDSPLTGDLNSMPEIVFSHQQNNLSFEFAALHYANPDKNQYAHFLKGYDSDWVFDNRSYASYTNLDPGAYEFMVRASNSYGVWTDDAKSIQITINPPWWKTIVAYAIYLIFFIALIIGFDRYMRHQVRLRERERTRERMLKQAKEIEKAYKELKATQNQLVQAEKMASLGELTAGIAHEIQNPLNFVNNFAEVSNELLDELKEEIKSGNFEEVNEIVEDVNQNLKKILHHGQRADAIVKNMLLHSRGNSGKKEPTDINALADEYLRLSFHGLRAKDKSFNADFKLEQDEKLPKIKVVPQDIGRVLLNLINNAFYAVNEKKNQLNSDYHPQVSVNTKLIDKGSKFQICVSDNGNGIPEEVKEKIFQPFFTTKPSGQGTGLGLSLSYDIIKAHGGELKVETEEGEGTIFNIQLPI